MMQALVGVLFSGCRTLAVFKGAGFSSFFESPRQSDNFYQQFRFSEI